MKNSMKKIKRNEKPDTDCYRSHSALHSTWPNLVYGIISQQILL